MSGRNKPTEAELAVLRRRYPDEPTADVAAALGWTISATYGIANKRGIHKSAAFWASDRSGRIARGRTDPRMMATQFKPGLIPRNKGVKRPGFAPGRMATTQFKPGCRRGAANSNYVPIGALHVTKDGILERKVTDDPSLYPARRWIPVARLVWEEAYGEIPANHVVRFKPGMHTTIAAEITVERLECISKAANMRRNSIHRYPRDIRRTMQLVGALNRQINVRSDPTQEEATEHG